MNQIVSRASLAEIASRRDRALDLYTEAHGMVMAANDKLREAADMLRAAAPAASIHHLSKEDREKIFGSFTVASFDVFHRLARHMVDVDVWSSVLKTTDLERLMDKKAKDQLRQQLITDPPEFTEETAFATLEQFMAESGMIFRRGIAEVFSNLDRRFRSHSGWKIGSRIILSRAFGDSGHWNYHANHRDTLQDIERTFLILDGRKSVAQYAGIVGEIDEARNGGWGERQTEVESEFYKVRIFQNGNAHLWFKRDDLVRIANRMIGEYYGEVIPEERQYEDDGGLNDPKRAMAKNYGFFPTPDGLAERTIDEAKLYSPKERLTVLEPSAGTGQLARRAIEKGSLVDCIEFQPQLAAGLRGQGVYRKVYQADFLELKPETIGLYDRIIMNPPFDRERDIDHVMHAMKFLKDGGFLIAIMSAHTEFAETRKAVAFREFMTKLGASWRDNPSNSFSSVGTNVNTLTLRVFKDGARVW